MAGALRDRVKHQGLWEEALQYQEGGYPPRPHAPPVPKKGVIACLNSSLGWQGYGTATQGSAMCWLESHCLAIAHGNVTL